MMRMMVTFYKCALGTFSMDKNTHSRANRANWSIDTRLSSGSLGSSWARGSSRSNLSLCVGKEEVSEGLSRKCNSSII